MTIWQREMSIDMLNERSKNSMADFLQIRFVEIGEDFLVARMPVDSKTKQPIGIMHGGASCVLAETIGSTAANCAVNASQFYCVGLDINTNHIRSIREGFVVGIAKPFHRGRTTHVWGIDIFNEEEQMISVNRLTMAVLAR